MCLRFKTLEEAELEAMNIINQETYVNIPGNVNKVFKRTRICRPMEYDMILGYQRYRTWKLYVGFEFDLMLPSLYYTRERKLVLDP